MDNPFDTALQLEGLSGPLAALARSVYGQESGGGKNTQTSNAGAVGGMQILPKTFAGVADQGWDIKDPVHNIRGGIRYLKQLHDMAGGDPALTAIGYYGGPKAMAAARNGVAVRDPRNPNAPDTFEYADQVLNRLPDPASYNRPVRKGVNPMPVSAPAPTNMEPTYIPAYHGVPDEWSRFGRAVSPPEPVTPKDLGYGDPRPVVAAPDGGIMGRYMPQAVQPLMAAFKRWGR